LNESVPDKSPVALLFIDVINEFPFPEASALLRHAEPMAGAADAEAASQGGGRPDHLRERQLWPLAIRFRRDRQARCGGAQRRSPS
jgi:hypothetical protein